MNEYLKKLEFYCVYQERCHHDVLQKLYLLKCPKEFHDDIIAYLITNNYVNEERYAILYAQSKFHQKHWGRIRLENELKIRNISSRNIQTAIKNINKEEYFELFNFNSEKLWNTITEKNKIKKLKKFTDYWSRKGFEQDLIFEKGNELLK